MITGSLLLIIVLDQAANAKKHPGLKVIRENFEEFQVWSN